MQPSPQYLERFFLFDKRIVPWWREEEKGAIRPIHKKFIRIDKLDKAGDKYRIVGSAAKHLVEITEPEREINGERIISSPKEWILFQGGVEIYNENMLLASGSIWRTGKIYPNLFTESGLHDFLFYSIINKDEIDRKIVTIYKAYEYQERIEEERLIKRISHVVIS